MKARIVLLGCVLGLMMPSFVMAQTPVLGSIQAPYPAVQSQVKIAGGTYGPGAVSYGPAGTPLVLTGSNFGTNTGTVQFIGTSNGAPNGRVAQAAVSMWSSSMIFLQVPSGATTGLVKVTTGAGQSNGLPFMVTPGSYSASCPASPSDNDFQIVTASLHDGSVGKAYAATLSATGGNPPYTWSLIGGSLPVGISLSSGGTVSGTPSSPSGPANLTIRATDRNQETTQAILSFTVNSQAMSTGTVYSYTVPTSGYDGTGNLLSFSDSVMGAWSFSYDTLNRLSLGSASTGDYAGQYGCLNYDNVGNRLQQVISDAAFQSGSGGGGACEPQSTASAAVVAANFNGNNQITITNARGTIAVPNYDASGNMGNDGVNSYLYDAEGRICAVSTSLIPGSGTMTGYLYDSDGQRVGKGPITSWTCDPGASGLQFSENYVLGPSGEELTMFDGSNHWQRTNVFGGGKLLATYDTKGLHFHITDPLGTRRLQTNASGQPELECENLPFGDQMNCFPDSNAPSTADDATPLHFTGKERDSESGNDYFGARYYASSMGRFLSPDPLMASAHPENPQTWNRYSYALNNPLRITDPEGLYPSPAFNCDKDHKACLSDDQRRILNNSNVKMGDKSYSGEALWNALGAAKNGEALQNSFVNQTDGLASIKFSDGKSAISFVNSITDVHQDRIFASVSSGLATELAGDKRFTNVSASLHSEGGFDALSFKSTNYPQGNIQFSFNSGRTGVDIDHDLYMPGVMHLFGEVLVNHMTGGLTNQDSVRQMLIKNPNIGLTPSPDPNWNRK